VALSGDGLDKPFTNAPGTALTPTPDSRDVSVKVTFSNVSVQNTRTGEIATAPVAAGVINGPADSSTVAAGAAAFSVVSNVAPNTVASPALVAFVTIR
jgi:hypothetical protein